MRYFLLTLLLVWLVVGATGCETKPEDNTKQQATVPSTATPSSELPPALPEPEQADQVAPIPPAKQLVLLYTGDTLSALEANTSYDPPQGGLPALTNAIASYLSEIAAYNRLRIKGEGGDPSGLGVDFAARRVGEHPYMLIDYGGWERPNDFTGELFVALQTRMFLDMSYDAVGALLAERLRPADWQAYQAVQPELSLLTSAGAPPKTTLKVVPLVTREVHGDQWGLVLVPMAPEPPGTPREKVDQMTEHMQPGIEEAAALLASAHCRFSVLSAAGGTREIYEGLAQDERFTVVLGVHGPLELADGRGAMPSAGPLMLPELEPGGRELGVLHLYYEPQGEVPVQYYFSRKVVEDDASKPWPYRKLIPGVIAEHQARLDEFLADQRQLLDQRVGGSLY